MSFIKIPVKGMNDFLPQEMRLREFVINKIKETYQSFGFNIIETPCLEHIENLCSKQGGENEKLIFKVLKRGEKLSIDHIDNENDLVDMGLRYDLTVPLSRYYANNMAKLPSPFKALQIGNVWRAERPQKGRFRQFVQCDIDILGEKSNLAEIELMQATTTLLTKIGFDGFKIRINDRRILKAMVEYAKLPLEDSDKIFIILDKMDKIGKEGVKSELLNNGYDKTAVDRYMNLFDDAPFANSTNAYFEKVAVKLENQEVLDNLDQIIDNVTKLSCGKFTICFDPTLVRGMSYYTGPIFEIGMDGFNGSVAGGGRYDNMVEKYANINVPACGFSIGFERIISILLEKDHHLLDHEKKRVAMVIDKNTPSSDLAKILDEANKMREDGKIVLVVYKSKNFKFQKERLLEDGFSDIIF